MAANADERSINVRRTVGNDPEIVPLDAVEGKILMALAGTGLCRTNYDDVARYAGVRLETVRSAVHRLAHYGLMDILEEGDRSTCISVQCRWAPAAGE